MLITKEVEIGLIGKTIKWYENRGYEIPRYYNIQNKEMMVKKGTKIIVKIEDLIESSNVKVNIECDGCEKELIGIHWCDYKRYVQEDGKYFCQKCALNGNIKWVSFYEWCYLHLTKEEADLIMSRWDNDLNVNKNGEVLSPRDIGFSANSKYWFKCLDYQEHVSELKNINGFTHNKGSLTCNQCNSIAYTHPNLVKYLVNKEDAYKYSYGTREKLLIKCPDCGQEKEMSIISLINSGFACPKCSDGISYPEKFFFNFLEQLLDKDFKVQLSKTTFKWCENYRYDNYINKINCIVETHGLQHYEEPSDKHWMSLQENQENDFDKEWLAKQNKINNYIILDCRKSEMEWIRDSVMNSRLPQLLDFKESDIDWLKCHEFACNSLVKVVCDLWNNGINNLLDIVDKLLISHNTVRKYLKQGNELEWCVYNSRIGIDLRNKKHCIKVICLTTGEIFDSQKEAGEKYNIKNCGNISACCTDKHTSAGKHPITNEPLVWQYYSEYLKLQEN